jgi:hypothetical protein
MVISFSPGIAQGCFDLLEMADRMPLSFAQIPSAFARLGGLPGGRVVETVQESNWLRASEDGIAMLILICIRNGINNPFPCGDTFDAVRRVFEIA